MQVKFWGARGSIPAPGLLTTKYGGNTACLKLHFEDSDRCIIIDAGSGIRELGERLIARGVERCPRNIDLFITHTHMDHILGFPFFAPIYQPQTHLKIHGPVTFEHESLQDVLGGQLSYHYFPVRLEELPSQIEYINLKEGEYDLGDGIKLKTKYLNHSLLCMGYRFEYRHKVFCTAYDTEPYRNLFAATPEAPDYDASLVSQGEAVADESNRALEEFYRGADMLVYDAQYTQAEYEKNRLGWGHSSFEYAMAAAKRAKVKCLVFFHHDPMRTDSELDALYDKYHLPHLNGTTSAMIAREGMQLDI